jgi:hypothetical protein
VDRLAALALLIAALTWADVPAQEARARQAAERFGPKGFLIEMRVSLERGEPELSWQYFDGESNEEKDLFLDAEVRSEPPIVRLQRAPRRERSQWPARLDLSRAGSWTALKFTAGEQPSKWEPLRLRARPDGTACWRAQLKDGGAAYFDAKTGERSPACSEPFHNK